jgi:two-component system nitrogen regulation response regulator NtrX
VFLDIKMPQMDGLEVLKALKPRGSPPVVILSGHGTVRTAVEATKLGRVRLHREAAETRAPARGRAQRAQPAQLGEENRGSSSPSTSATAWRARAPPCRRCWDAMRRAAPTNATVLITGESGVGKELVARAIHRNSLRRTRRSCR